MISHGCVPNDLLLSTIIPIPKNKRKSLSKSDNYRAIALSSIMGKLLDKILLNKCHNIFKTSMYQYGFKNPTLPVIAHLSSMKPCNIYINNTSNVSVTLLDASRAFDRVEYVQLFKSLMSEGICPIIARFLVFMHTNRNIRIKWGNTYSDRIYVSNGVKQGGVMSPLLFTLNINNFITYVTFGVYIWFGGLIDGCSALGVVYDVSLEVVMTTRA